MLNQSGIDFDVIVVDKNSDDETLTLLEQLEAEHTDLRHIILPTTAHSINKDHLAVMLGVRAATWDRVIVTRPQCQPKSDSWLKDTVEAWPEDREILLLPTFQGKKPTLRQRFAINMAKHGHARWALGHALGYHRRLFMQSGGFPARTPQKMATMTILVRYYSNQYNTCVLDDAKYSLHSVVS